VATANGAVSEESTVTADRLADEARSLESLVGSFRLVSHGEGAERPGQGSRERLNRPLARA